MCLAEAGSIGDDLLVPLLLASTSVHCLVWDIIWMDSYYYIYIRIVRSLISEISSMSELYHLDCNGHFRYLLLYLLQFHLIDFSTSLHFRIHF
jgi:hypothetical protein